MTVKYLTSIIAALFAASYSPTDVAVILHWVSVRVRGLSCFGIIV